MKKYEICIVGLGYVGLPLAMLFSKKYDTIGFDNNKSKIEELRHRKNKLIITNNLNDTKSCNIYIVAVPTPVDVNNHPDLKPLLDVSESIGKVISKGDIVIYESTVYPGVTEEQCIPVIELTSGLKYNVDFFAGYSPERINPGDKLHSVENITKVTSGSTPEIADEVDALYNSVLLNGTFKASSIRVAEASKIIENTQRDVNIAFMNETAKILNAMGIDTHEVLEAASTKWNFIKLKPGLVGGHCIGVDPYYLIEKAQAYGILPRIMSDARNLNDSMGDYVANQTIMCMNKKGVMVKDAHFLIMGFTFKENCSDIRNSRVIDIYDTLRQYSDYITVYAPHADIDEVKKLYGIDVIHAHPESLYQQFDAVILAVNHAEFQKIHVRNFLRIPNGVVYDVKSVLPLSDVDARL
jgi:UDP-N-acetyl-D-galactosamine dehydrogenase